MRLGIAIVEDDPHFRASLEALFAEESEFFVEASFPTAVAFLEKAEAIAARGASPNWDLVLMDIELPGLTGIEATSRLKRLMPQVPVVVVTVFEEPATILEAICAGAVGYLLKKTPVPELLAQLRSVVAGGSPLTPGVARSLLDVVRREHEGSQRAHAEPTRLDLSEREQDVLRCLTRGLSYKQVAYELGLSADTVRTYIRRMYQKLQVHSASEAVSRAIHDRLV